MKLVTQWFSFYGAIFTLVCKHYRLGVKWYLETMLGLGLTDFIHTKNTPRLSPSVCKRWKAEVGKAQERSLETEPGTEPGMEPGNGARNRAWNGAWNGAWNRAWNEARNRAWNEAWKRSLGMKYGNGAWEWSLGMRLAIVSPMANERLWNMPYIFL